MQGKYCQDCGQENVVPHETFWHMVKHFLYDITHFDSKFFDSMKYLLFRPGFLPLEYIKGRRASYLNPVKKYVFTSAVFFLLFFGFFVKPGTVSTGIDQPLTLSERTAQIKKGELELAKNPQNESWQKALEILRDTSRTITGADLAEFWEDFSFINISDRSYRSRKEYDSVQAALPPGERDDWLTRLVQIQNQKLKEKYRNDPRTGSAKIIDTFLHKLPYLLFVSLPIFALLLKLLYIRRKQFYYADHGIFSIYHYIFTFFLLTAVFLLDELVSQTGVDDLEIVTLLVFLSGGLYLYLSMKRFYGQGHGKTLLKFLLLNFGGAITLVVLFLLFLLLALFQI